jgi:hypothetical protein
VDIKGAPPRRVVEAQCFLPIVDYWTTPKRVEFLI